MKENDFGIHMHYTKYCGCEFVYVRIDKSTCSKISMSHHSMQNN